MTKVLDFNPQSDAVQIFDVPGYSVRYGRGSALILDGGKNLIGSIPGVQSDLNIIEGSHSLGFI
jgi:hypothetical protein